MTTAAKYPAERQGRVRDVDSLSWKTEVGEILPGDLIYIHFCN